MFHSSEFPSDHLGIVYFLNFTVFPSLVPHGCPPPLWLPLLSLPPHLCIPHVEIKKVACSRLFQSGSCVMINHKIWDDSEVGSSSPEGPPVCWGHEIHSKLDLILSGVPSLRNLPRGSTSSCLYVMCFPGQP